ncbi:LuxR family transcriptional regulator [Krasilnikovia sp. MM14-A1259]
MLEGLLASAVAGKGKAAIVTGVVGTGKTALLDTFAERAVDLNGLAITATGTRAERNLPLGVLTQLLMDAPLVTAERQRAMDLLVEGAHSIVTGADGGAQLEPQLVHALCAMLLELAQRYPLAIVVDDIDHADPASLVCLSYLARRARFVPMMTLFSHAANGQPGDSLLELEALGRSPHGASVTLSTLSADGVRMMAATALPERDALRVAARWHQLSGGNPVLVGGLLADVREGGAADGEPVTGGRYAEAVVACLRRIDPCVARVAHAVAVLPGPNLHDKLLQIDGASVARAVRMLTAAGLLHHGDFRHPLAHAAVLTEIEPTERQELHRRAALLAYHDGATSRVVADQLVGAGQPEGSWVLPILEDAARQALREGRVDAAVRYLDFAWRACDDNRHRAKIMTTMLRASWRINPSTSTDYLPSLTAALHHGFLRPADAMALAKALLWNGQFVEAKAVFEHVNTATGELDRESVTELTVARPLLRATYPRFSALLRQPPPDPPATSTVAASHRLEAANALATVLTRGPVEHIAGAVDRILHNSQLDEMSLDTVESALLALVYGGWTARAVPWCDLFMEEAVTRRAPSRLARLAALRGEMALRLGDLPAALRHAQFALDTMPPSSWGVAIGAPVSVLITAATAMGRHDLAREQLDQPVPEEMFHTRYGLPYLIARGRYSSAIGQLVLAQRDFARCGELAGSWQMDVPGLAPWRVEVAETMLRLGRPQPARKLIDDQLRRCGEHDTRVQGMAMRLLAATSEVRHRPLLLRQAADLLSGDEYELGRALVDLNDAYQELGEPRRAGMVARRAQALAERCESQRLFTGLSPEPGGEVEKPPPVALPGSAAVLSEAERRVAGLAADGYTNREISKKLFITISTVEQHLTRIYRKLNVSRRTDLPTHLPVNFTAGI